MPHVLEGAGEVQKRGCRTSAAVEVVDLSRRLDIAVVMYGILGPVRGIHQAGKGIFSSVAAAEAMSAGVKEASGVRTNPCLHRRSATLATTEDSEIGRQLVGSWAGLPGLSCGSQWACFHNADRTSSRNSG